MAGSGTTHLRDDALLRVEDLVVEHRSPQGVVKAVSGVSFDVRRGETLGIVGESGCGKSSVARAVMQLPSPNSGQVTLGDEPLVGLPERRLRRTRARMQMIFQDPISSLNPLRRVETIVAEGLALWDPKGDHAVVVDGLLEAVGLDPVTDRKRRPHQFSGGQCQRICIARALALQPDVVICDEPVSALDVSVQAQIVNLLAEMKQRYGLTLLFIAHDLAVVKQVSDRVIVMYLGKTCEVAGSDRLFEAPAHPYTAALIEAIPNPDPRAPIGEAALAGEVPSPVDPPSGCRFRTRCPRATERCAAEEPTMRAVGEGHFVACHHPLVDVVPG